MATSPHQKKLIRLIQKYLSGKASSAEKQFLEAYYNCFDNDDELQNILEREERSELKAAMKTAIWERIDNTAQTPVYRRAWFRMMAAAAVLLMIGVPVYYISIHNKNRKPLAKSDTDGAPAAHAIVPGGNMATLTLGDGSTIVLDSAGNGMLRKQAHAIIIKQNGQLHYQHNDHDAANDLQETVYNTVATPRGGQYQVVLPDGSKVWLNAASSLRFPTAFAANERRVEITGEAYFEIVKNQNKPFKVSIVSPAQNGGGTEVEVLGTHFNVNAYSDEATIKTTLLEGSVKIMYRESSMVNGQWTILKPGEQASVSQSSHASHSIPVQTVDVEETVAWKNGLFYFDNVDIQTIMRQLARWYQVQVVFRGNIPARRFAGQVSRTAPLAAVLKILELSKVHFTVDGNTITVVE